MKLSLLSFDIGKHLDLPTLLQTARKNGFAGVELRMQLGHQHGVDLHLDEAGRRAVRDQFDDALIDLVGLTTSNRFEYPDAKQRRESVDEVKRYLELAAELDADRVRVFGNDMPKDGTPRGDVIKYVGDSLRELGEFAEDHLLEVNLEMHGQFNWWRYAVRAVEWAEHPAVGIVYNCDPRDVVGGSVSETLSRVVDYVNHVHMHDLSDADYPYREFLGLMKELGYSGYLSAEIGESADAERVLAYYGALYRAYLGR
ncbi:MAG: sugar phosphate isomerase/epimerase [Armatimonadetes bacterium]|nr:sugar phosphate isomerase/epimerase [Armatimonadota bacterium]